MLLGKGWGIVLLVGGGAVDVRWGMGVCCCILLVWTGRVDGFNSTFEKYIAPGQGLGARDSDGRRM